MALTPGSRIGSYEIGAQIGVGGMGEVYRATDTNLARQVAIKVLPDAVAADAERLARFDREAKTLAALNHPNIAQIYGLERSGAQTALVMELVEGPTLADRIADGPVPVDEALAVARQLAEALEAAHEQGIIHRDLKPANIKLRPDGTVKVLDFGLAKALEPAAGSSSDQSMSPTITTPAMTQAGLILGTAAYMSPEQARGKPVDRRADIWAFGCVLFEMLTGARAFDSEDISLTLADVMRGEPGWAKLPSHVSPTLVTWLKRCLQKDPRDRVQAIGDVRLALGGAFDVTSAPANVRSAEPTATPLRARMVPLVATAIVVGVAALLIGRWSALEPPRPVSRFGMTLPDGRVFGSPVRTVLAVSPDGDALVYTGPDGLYLKRRDMVEAQLIAGSGAGAMSPVFSLDGQEVAFYHNLRRELMRLTVTGGTAIPLVATNSNPFGISWADDGTILYGQPDGIWRVSENGGMAERIVQAAGNEIVHGPRLLPGGEWVLYTVGVVGAGATRWEGAEIVVQSLVSDERRVVHSGGSDARYVPTGHLVYALESTLYGVAFDLDTLETAGSPRPVVTGVQRAVDLQSGAAFYDVAADGTLAYVPGEEVRTAERRVVWVDRTGREQPVELLSTGSYQSPRLSPDGERVLLWESGDAHIASLTTGRVQRMTTGADGNFYGAWSRENRLAYSAVNEAGSRDIWTRAADSSDEPMPLATSTDDLDVESFSPDGRLLALHRHERGRDTNEDLFFIDLEAPEPELQPILIDEFPTFGASFSPDGDYLAYVSQARGQFDVYIRPFPGPGPVTIVSSAGGGIEPVWRGDELFYRRDSDRRMMVVEVETRPALTLGPPVELFDGKFFPPPGNTLPMAQYDVTADGQRFLVLRNVGEEAGVRSQLVTVQNWFEELRRLVPTE